MRRARIERRDGHAGRAAAWTVLAGSWLLVVPGPGAGQAAPAQGADAARAWHVGAGVDEHELTGMRMLAQRLVQRGDYERALAAHEAIVAAAPANPVVHYEHAGTLSFLRHYHQARQAIERAIALDPDRPRYHALAALVYEALGEEQTAAAATRRAAVRGDAQAMFSMAQRSRDGRGVPRDASAALRWAAAAAEAGHLGAMALLEQAYREGRLEQAVDPEKAQAWRRRLEEAEAAFELQTESRPQPRPQDDHPPGESEGPAPGHERRAMP